MSAANVMPLNAGGVPLFLRQQSDRWSTWDITVGKDGRVLKVPKCPKTLRWLSVRSPDGWTDYATACDGWRKHRGAGLGYRMTGPHGLVGVDLDDCLDELGIPSERAQEIIDRLKGYTEVSPSGTGLRIFVRGALPSDCLNKAAGVELYAGHTPRFLTVTGQRHPGSADDVPQADPAALEWLFATYGRTHAESQPQTAEPTMPEPMGDAELPTVQDLLDMGLSRRDVYLLTDPQAHFDEGADKSNECIRLARLLASYGFTAQEVYSLLRKSNAVFEVALNHRPRGTEAEAARKADFMIWKHWASKAHFEWQRKRQSYHDAFDDDFLNDGLTIDVEAREVKEPDALPPAEKTQPKIETKMGVADGGAEKPSVAGERRELIAARAAEFKLYTINEFMAMPQYKQNWLISKVLPLGELGFIVGNRGSGKTFFTLDMIIHLANGWEWRHLKVRPSKVIYYAAEGANGLQNRVAAWERFNDKAARCDNLLLLAPEAGLNLADPVDYAAMTVMLQQAGGADLIVIDTFSQVTPGLDENSGQVMSELIARTVKWARRNGCMVLFVGHTGKNSDAGLRGWSGLQAAADVIISVERDAKTEERAAVLTKLKEGQDMLRLPFRLERVRFPDQQTNLGDPVESSLAYAVGAPLEPPSGARVPTLDDMILAAVADWQGLPEAEGQPLDAARLVGHVLAQRPEYTGGIIERALDRLVQAGLVRRDGGMLTPP